MLPLHPTCFCLTELAAITVTGADRITFLQGQLTCDVLALTSVGDSVLAGHCDPKGHLWSTMRVVLYPDAIILLLKASAAPQQLAQLKKYAVFAAVELTLASIPCYGVAGAGTDAWLVQRQDQAGYVIPLAPDRALIIDGTATGLPCGDESLWWGLELVLGLPHIEAATQGLYTPHMLNLVALGGVSFTKGCYIGQETVARAEYRGANHRGLFVLQGQAEGNAVLGDAIEIQLPQGWKKIGTVCASYSAAGKLWLQGVLPADTAADASLRLALQPTTLLRRVV